MDDLLREFLEETTESLGQLDTEIVQLEQNPNDPNLLSSIFRMMHTIKGTCGFIGLPRLETLAHAAENVLGKVREGKLEVTPYAVSLILEAIDQIKFIVTVLDESGTEPEGDDNALKASLNALADGEETAPATEGDPNIEEAEESPFEPSAPLAQETMSVTAEENAPVVAAPAPKAQAAAAKENKENNQSIRVTVELLENLMNMVSELVLTRNQLVQIARNQKESEFTVPLQRLSHVTTELQEGVMKTRMQPIGNAWAKLPRIIRDLSLELGKKIDLQMIGEETELDRQVLEMIKDPLTHMVRNSADHGVETSADRKTSGKAETGTIRLEANHEGGHIVIRISDDGRGLNIKRIREKIIANDLASVNDVEKMSDVDVQQFIFKAGFSTAAHVTSVSGRGVGMDVVRTNIEKIGGTIELQSVEGQGSTFTIKIPLTLAIVSALIVDVCGERFAIPQLSVVELVRVTPLSELQIEHINDAPVLRLRNKLLPLVSLQKVLDLSSPVHRLKKRSKSLFIVVTQVGAHRFGMIVDRVDDTEEIVVKPVAPILKNISVFSGNTILGDGSVIMILDPNGVAAKLGEFSNHGENNTVHDEKKQTRSGEEKVSLLVFEAGGKAPHAVPLALVARLEEVEASTIEYSNGQAMVQYREALMPLIRINDDYQINSTGAQQVLVFADGNHCLGMVVERILDIVEETVTINLQSDKPGQIGSCIIRGQATDLIDAHYYINQTFADWFRAEKRNDPKTLSNHRLLLVDDSAFFRNLLAPVLSAGGFQVVTAENPIQALQLRKNGEEFCLIISDIEMPEMDGFGFARAVKSEGIWKDIPMIALSSHTSKDVVEKGREAGFSEYVPKFDRDALMETIQSMLGVVE
jgi:two-component system, chemotaxis family, sensor kinase CheA